MTERSKEPPPDAKLELECLRIEAQVRKIEAHAKVRQVVYGTMIVGLAAAAFPFAQKFAELRFAERIESARLDVEEKRAVFEDERQRREFLNTLAGEARSEEIEKRIILAEFFAHMAVKKTEQDQWREFLEFLHDRQKQLNEERQTLVEVLTSESSVALQIAAAQTRLDQIQRFETPSVSKTVLAPTLYDSLIGAISGTPTPLLDPRVQGAIASVLNGDATAIPYARRLLAEAGYPNGFALEVTLLGLPGRLTQLEELRRRLEPLGIKIVEIADR